MSHSRPTTPMVPSLLGLALGGCEGVQSALSASGDEAHDIRLLLWIAGAVCAATLVLVLVFGILAFNGSARVRAWIARDQLIVSGGLVLPVVVLSGLLAYALLVLQAGAARSAFAGEPSVTIIGKRWWWKVIYRDSEGREVVSANELRLPLGQPISLRLITDDVIHSFWAPKLAGKLDMIPGRTNVLTVQSNEVGVSRGQCAEYCGGAHALMAFYVVTLPEEEYQAWLAREASKALPPATEAEKRGHAVFVESGCGACHTIRGTEARGTIGPDLTHVGSRMSLAAATLPNDANSFARWITDNQHIKPENLMPPFRHFKAGELDTLANYLDSLK
ncbi:cytochrome c oxidase subunit II [Dongia deserti]|uniref:cytochrome c oxidase subunit II n=1 Tax=Dongia deserti TaxID=2268030 RepID=UPI0025465E8A|nr:c-type cytochrome [Dongia deserti]